MQEGVEMEVDSLLRRKYENNIKVIEVVHMEDLDLVSRQRCTACCLFIIDICALWAQ